MMPPDIFDDKRSIRIVALQILTIGTEYLIGRRLNIL